MHVWRCLALHTAGCGGAAHRGLNMKAAGLAPSALSRRFASTPSTRPPPPRGSAARRSTPQRRRVPPPPPAAAPPAPSVSARDAKTYAELFEANVQHTKGVLRSGDPGFVAELLGSEGSPGWEVAFRDITDRSLAILMDAQVASFVAHAGRAAVAGRCTRYEAIQRCVTLVNTAEYAGHLVAAKSYLELMRIAWAADTDDARRLILSAYRNIADNYVAAKANITSNSRILEMFDPPPDVWILAIKAASRLTPVPKEELSAMLKRITKAADSAQHCKTQPLLWSALYIGWMCVDPQKADSIFRRATEVHRSYTRQAWVEYISHAGDIGNGLRMLRSMERAGFPADTRAHNSVLLAGLHGEDNRLPSQNKPRTQMVGELLSLMSLSLVRPDEQTLSIIAALYRREEQGEEGFRTVMRLRDEYSLPLSRSCLTSLISAQIPSCGKDSDSVDRAETCMLEILDRGLLNEKPYGTAFHCFGRLMMCYAKAGELARMESLRDAFAVRIATGDFHDPSTRFVSTAMKNAFSEVHRTAASIAVANPNTDWGGPLHLPWRPASSDETLKSNPPDGDLDIWP